MHLSPALFLRLLFVLACVSAASADDWPQWRGPNRDGVWAETGVVQKFAGKQLKPAWRKEIGSGYSGPTVAKGRVYVTDRLVEPKQVERVHCFDSKNGKPLWSHAYDCEYLNVGYTAGPRASVSVDDGRAYSLGAMGHLFCFDAAKGDVLWQHDLGGEYKIRMPIWGIAASPLVYEDTVIVQIGGQLPDAKQSTPAGQNDQGACVVAFDKRTGKQRWTALNDNASYSAPVITKQAGKQVLVVWTGDNVAGLNPTTGEVYWKFPFPPKKMVIGIVTPVIDHGRLFVSSFYDGALMLKLDPDKLAVEKVWSKAGPDEQHTEAIHGIISTSLFSGDYLYGVDSYGELRCLNAKTGERIWESLKATPKARWSTIHMVRNGEDIWMFNERGDLIISKLSPQGYTEISRAKLIEPTSVQLSMRGGVCWSHPAFAERHVFARNDEAIVCASLIEGEN